MAQPNIGQVRIEAIDIDPVEVLPGGRVRMSIKLTETAEFVGPFGQLALCNPDTVLSSTGLRVRLIVDPAWTSGVTETVCVPVFNLAQGELEVDVDLTAPNGEGNYTVNTWIESTKNGESSSTLSNTVRVSTGSGADPGPGDDDDDKGGDFDSAFLNFAIENPVGTAIIGIGGVIVLREATEALVAGE